MKIRIMEAGSLPRKSNRILNTRTSDMASLRRSARKNSQTPKCLCTDHSVNPKRGRPRKRMGGPLEVKKDGSLGHHSGGDPNNNDQATLSEYELKRLENIRQNKAFLSFLHLPQLADALKPKKMGMRKIREKVVKEVLPVRKSLRLLKKTSKSPVKRNRVDEPSKEVYCLKGPVPMCPVNFKEGSQLPDGLLHLWTEERVECERKNMDLQEYKEELLNMHVREEQVLKVVKRCISSAAFHPCASSLLIAAADLSGQIGLWSPGASWGDSGLVQFEPHTSTVTCMAFSRSQPATLITTSTDGSTREGDVERAMFAEVYRSDEALKGFDFLSDDCTTLLIAGILGNVVVVDTRTPGASHESVYALGPKMLRTVHIHPMQKHYFVAAMKSEVHIYDVRNLQKQFTQPVSVLDGHDQYVSSAYFSPHTGNRVLTTSKDDIIRLFDTSQLVSSAPQMASIDVGDRHRKSYCWPQGKALWDPTREDCFVMSTPKHPCKIKVFHERGELVHAFDRTDRLTMCSVMAFHPSRRVLLGGDAQGRLHVIA